MAMGKNPFQALLEEIPAPLRNKYFLVLLAFFAWMMFFDRHDFITQWQLQRSVDQLENDKEYYSKKIEEAEQDRYDLDVNREKFAREHYYLQKSNEDVFIIKKQEELE
jgi:cell division protein DivIC